MKGFLDCEAKCNMHDECAGFVFRKSTNICGSWQRSPLKVQTCNPAIKGDCKPYFKPGYFCHQKPKGKLNVINELT